MSNTCQIYQTRITTLLSQGLVLLVLTLDCCRTVERGAESYVVYLKYLDIIINEIHDLAIARSSSSRADSGLRIAF